MSFNTDTPWLPSDAGEQFQPKSHFDSHTDTDTPMVVTPRGGGRQVGRSCYQVDISMTGMATETGGAKKTGESKGSEETPTNWTDTRLAIASPLFLDPLNMIALAWLVYTLYNLGNYLL